MKLLDILEGWYDPPEYDEPSGDSFVDDDYNYEELLFNYLGHDKESGLFIVQHIGNGKKYVGHTDSIDYDMYQADTYTEYDQDEDGHYSYERVDKENAELTTDSMRLLATIAFNEGEVGLDFDQWETGYAITELSNVILRGFFLNDKETYRSLIKLINDIDLKRRSRNGR